jgi:L-threonylcarbamoyladenylate synthase
LAFGMGLLIKLKGKELEEIDHYLDIAVESICEGKLIAFPTNSVYGLGGDPFNSELIEKIYGIKYRERSKGLLLLVADIEEATKIGEFNALSEKLAKKFWPGQLTLILNKKESCLLPPELTAFQNTIGLRVPENEIILRILEKLKKGGNFGGIIGTSANYSGEPPSISGDEIAKKFLAPIDLIIDGGKAKSKIPTTIVDVRSGYIKLLREGIIKKEDLEEIV